MYKMYLVSKEEKGILEPCPYCSSLGMVAADCQACNGKGVRVKRIKWHVPKKIDVVKIDRNSEPVTQVTRDGGAVTIIGALRYWIDEENYYGEPQMLVHFTKEDAKEECFKLNRRAFGLPLTTYLMKLQE